MVAKAAFTGKPSTRSDPRPAKSLTMPAIWTGVAFACGIGYHHCTRIAGRRPGCTALRAHAPQEAIGQPAAVQADGAPRPGFAGFELFAGFQPDLVKRADVTPYCL